jgi:putative autotransporter adhesin-like protein
MRTLAVVGGAGLAISCVCFALAAAIDSDGLRGIGEHGWFFGRCKASAQPNITGDTRELAWDGDDKVTINVPATVHYRPDAGSALRASGPPELLSHLRVRDGRIGLDCNAGHFDRELDLVLPGRGFEVFTLNGTGHLILDDLKQAKLVVNLRGSADVRATGTADDLNLNMAGSGRADLGKLSVQSSKVRIAGSGEAELSPKESADINIAGSGEIRFLTQPRNVQTHIAGSGRIINAPPDRSAPAPSPL